MQLHRLLSVTIVALGLSSLSASAASVYDATQSLTLTVIRGDDDVAMTYTPDDPFVSVLATGDVPTFASASALGTAADVSLTGGSSFNLVSEAAGNAGDNAVANVSEAEARKSGTLTLENTGEVAAQILFEILYDMTWLATVADPLTETATAEVFWEIVLGETTLFSKSFKADALAGQPGGTDENTPNSLFLLVELDGSEIKEYTFRAISKGKATTTPSLVPLPAAGWLLLAGLGGLLLAARRRAH